MDGGGASLLRLARVQTLALTALVPVIGAAVFYGLSADGAWDHLGELALLFATGACLHVYGFVLNEWADLEVDRASKDLGAKPLVSGAVPPRAALAGAVAVGLLGFMPLLLVSRDPWPAALYAASLALGGVYDIWGKRAPLDHVLAASLSALLLAGTAASGAFDAGNDRHRFVLVGLLALQYFQNLFQNAVEGGIKDADHDAAAGARTFAAITGTRVDGGRLRPTAGFLLASWTVKGLHLGFLAWMAVCVVGLDVASAEGAFAAALVAIAALAMVATMWTFLGDMDFDRARLKRRFSAHEMATYLGTVAVVVPLVGAPFAAALVALPMTWYLASNVALYGRPLEPGV